MLIAAAEGIAIALDVTDMVGIGASNQLSANYHPRDGLITAYDDFWLAIGCVPLARNMYHLAVPTLSKPIQSVKRNHRLRTLRKREYKRVIKEQVCRAFRDIALGCPSP
jgi:uncharacterized protein